MKYGQKYKVDESEVQTTELVYYGDTLIVETTFPKANPGYEKNFAYYRRVK